MSESGEERNMFGLVTGLSLAVMMMLLLILPMAFSAGKDTTYSAYVTTSAGDDKALSLSQVTAMRDSLGGETADGQDYSIANTMSTPLLVNDWLYPHRTMLLIIGPEKPLDETEAANIYKFVTESGGKVIIAADNTNANLVAAKFGVTYFDAPLLDQNQHWYEMDANNQELPENWKNVWSVAAINESVPQMSDAALKQGCSEQDRSTHMIEGCRMPVMFRAPTGLKVENFSEDEGIERDVKILAQASPSAFIDVMDNADSGDTRNPAPGDLALAVRIDYPGIDVQDRRAGGKNEVSTMSATGSIVFLSDQTTLSNRLWDIDEATATGMASECDVAQPSCWHKELTNDHQWNGNSHYYSALIYSMMEFDNQDLSTTVKLENSNFQIVFDESRHVTGVISAPFTETMSTIVLLTSDAFLKWLIIINVLLLLLVAMMIVPEKANWRHIFDLTRFRERPDKVDPASYRKRVEQALLSKVRQFYDLTADEMALKPLAEVQQMVGEPRLVELVSTSHRTYSPEELRQLLQAIRRWGKK